MSLIKLLKGPEVLERTLDLVQTFPLQGGTRGPAGVICVSVVAQLVSRRAGLSDSWSPAWSTLSHSLPVLL